MSDSNPIENYMDCETRHFRALANA